MSEKLFEAIAAGATDEVRSLVADDPALASARGADDVSAVRTARYRGRIEIVEMLVTAGADLDVFDAAALGRTDRLGEILGARPDLVDAIAPDGFTPLQLASFFGHCDAARLLVDRGAPTATVSANPMAIHALNAAAAGGHAEVVALLLDAGANPDARQHGGLTALMSCAAGGSEAGVTALLARGADPSALSDDGRGAAAFAEERGHSALAERLRS